MLYALLPINETIIHQQGSMNKYKVGSKNSAAKVLLFIELRKSYNTRTE